MNDPQVLLVMGVLMSSKEKKNCKRNSLSCWRHKRAQSLPPKIIIFLLLISWGIPVCQKQKCEVRIFLQTNSQNISIVMENFCKISTLLSRPYLVNILILVTYLVKNRQRYAYIIHELPLLPDCQCPLISSSVESNLPLLL